MALPDHGSTVPHLPSLDEAELYFLLVQALLQSPFQHLGRQLAEEAQAQGLLPRRHDVFGNHHPLSLSELQQRYAHVGAGSLQLALSSLLQYKQAEAPHPARQGVSSLLEAGALAVLTWPKAQAQAHNVAAVTPFPTAWQDYEEQQPATAGAAAGSAGAAAGVAAVPAGPPPRWMLPFHAWETSDGKLPMSRRLLLRETGVSSAMRQPRSLLPAPELAGLLRYQKTLRGHRAAVYCVAFDKTGGYVITGSDDRLVKVWSVRTGLLQSTCRGHDGEITDLSVSCDNSLAASSSMDTTIRVWQLQGDGRMGSHNCVLVGHTAPVSFVDFSPTLPGTLLSSSFDGTCRIWHARDPTAPPLVLRVDPLRFGGSGQGLMCRSLNQLMRDPSLSVEEQPAAAGRAHVAPEEATAAAEGSQDAVQLLVCGFSRDGAHIVAGSNDCHAYLWHWPWEMSKTAASSAPTAGGASAELGVEASLEAAGAAGATAAAGAAGALVASAAGASEQAGSPHAQAAGTHGSSLDGAAPWPTPQEVARLPGHRNDVVLLYFSNAGDRLATGSKDGSVRVWRHSQRGRRRGPGGGSSAGGGGGWALQFTIACPPDEEAVRRARQRRRAPPAPAIDQISWSCDDQRLVVSVTDHTVRVFDAATGGLLHSLRGHTEAVHVLECHPAYPRLAMSASYDGELVLWDIAAGASLQRLSSRDTRPDVRAWPDAIPLCDGHFSPEGCGLAVTDVAGQLHYYSFGGEGSLLSRGPYDQFLSSDYDLLMQDARFNVVDALTQLPAHVPTGKELLCDALGNAYPGPFQEAFRTRRLLAASPQDAGTREEGKQPGYLLASPLLTAAAWHAVEAGASDNSVLLAVARQQERLTLHEEALDDLGAQQQRRRQQAEQGAGAGGGPSGHQGPTDARREGGTGTAEAGGAGPGPAAGAAAAAAAADGWDEGEDRPLPYAEPTSSGELYHQPSDLDDYPESLSEDSVDSGEEYQGDEAGPSQGRRREGGRRSGRQSRHRHRLRRQAGLSNPGRLCFVEGRVLGSSVLVQALPRFMYPTREEEEEEAVRHSARLAGRRRGPGEATMMHDDSSPAAHNRHHAQHAGHADQEVLREQQWADREARSQRRQQLQERDLAHRRRRQQRQVAAPAGAQQAQQEGAGAGAAGTVGPSRGRRAAAGAAAAGGGGSTAHSHEAEPQGEAGREAEEDDSVSAEEQVSEQEEEQEPTSDEELPAVHACLRYMYRRYMRLQYQSEYHDEEEEEDEDPSATSKPRAAQAAVAGAAAAASQQPPSRHRAPAERVGDEVVYLREGHAQYLANTNDKRPPPWQQSVGRGRGMRPANPCRVVAVDYVISDDGHDYTLPSLTLVLTDEASPLEGRSFAVQLPHPAAEQAEFVVLRGRYNASIRRCWEVGHQCQMYWSRESGAGEWWVGAVADDRAGRGGNATALADPYGCGGQWDRFLVAWQGVCDAQGAVVPSPDAAMEPTLHSPWELFELGTALEDVRSEAPCLDPAATARLLAAAQQAAASERFELFAATPEWHECYQRYSAGTGQYRSEYYNRVVALPMSLADITARLQANYYHQQESAVSDIQLLVQNAATFNGEDSTISEDAQQLADCLIAAFEGTEAPNATASALLCQRDVSNGDVAHPAAAGALAAAGQPGPSGRVRGSAGVDGRPGNQQGGSSVGPASARWQQRQPQRPQLELAGHHADANGVPAVPVDRRQQQQQQQPQHDLEGLQPEEEEGEEEEEEEMHLRPAAAAAVPRRPRTLVIRPPRPPPGAEAPANRGGGSRSPAAAAGGGSMRLRINLRGLGRAGAAAASSQAGTAVLGRPQQSSRGQQQPEEEEEEEEEEQQPHGGSLWPRRDGQYSSYAAAAAASRRPPCAASPSAPAVACMAAAGHAAPPQAQHELQSRQPSGHLAHQSAGAAAGPVSDNGDESHGQSSGGGGQERAWAGAHRAQPDGRQQRQPSRTVAAVGNRRKVRRKQTPESSGEDGHREGDGTASEDDYDLNGASSSSEESQQPKHARHAEPAQRSRRSTRSQPAGRAIGSRTRPRRGLAREALFEGLEDSEGGNDYGGDSVPARAAGQRRSGRTRQRHVFGDEFDYD
ncbi:hypothetical protein N2152v2_004193 [Parachlorella kessleri]